MKILILTFGLICQSISFAQYAPSVGQVGTTAIKADSTIIVSWANSVLDFERGYQNIAISNYFTANGLEGDALGLALAGGPVVSIGDRGIITLGFEHPIKNGIGPDFAVFENSFSDIFLELALVEVSTNGVQFVRMPAISLTQTSTQIDPFGALNCEKIYNLAGKYKAGYGTPFDLEDIIDSTAVNLDSINYVRIIDVVGSINPTYASYDSQGNIINDPYPTNFSTGGFDLDAIAVINENKFVGLSNQESINIKIYPNPSNGTINIVSNEKALIEILNINGQMIKSLTINNKLKTISDLNKGIYIVKILSNQKMITKKIIVN